METVHEFETTLGDELHPRDLADATYKVVETFVTFMPDTPQDPQDDDMLVFTHRVELWQTDDQLMAAIPGETLGEKRASVIDALVEISNEPKPYDWRDDA